MSSSYFPSSSPFSSFFKTTGLGRDLEFVISSTISNKSSSYIHISLSQFEQNTLKLISVSAWLAIGGGSLYLGYSLAIGTIVIESPVAFGFAMTAIYSASVVAFFKALTIPSPSLSSSSSSQPSRNMMQSNSIPARYNDGKFKHAKNPSPKIPTTANPTPSRTSSSNTKTPPVAIRIPGATKPGIQSQEAPLAPIVSWKANATTTSTPVLGSTAMPTPISSTPNKLPATTTPSARTTPAPAMSRATDPILTGCWTGCWTYWESGASNGTASTLPLQYQRAITNAKNHPNQTSYPSFFELTVATYFVGTGKDDGFIGFGGLLLKNAEGAKGKEFRDKLIRKIEDSLNAWTNGQPITVCGTTVSTWYKSYVIKHAKDMIFQAENDSMETILTIENREKINFFLRLIILANQSVLPNRLGLLQSDFDATADGKHIQPKAIAALRDLLEVNIDTILFVGDPSMNDTTVLFPDNIASGLSQVHGYLTLITTSHTPQKTNQNTNTNPDPHYLFSMPREY